MNTITMEQIKAMKEAHKRHRIFSKSMKRASNIRSKSINNLGEQATTERNNSKC